MTNETRDLLIAGGLLLGGFYLWRRSQLPTATLYTPDQTTFYSGQPAQPSDLRVVTAPPAEAVKPAVQESVAENIASSAHEPPTETASVAGAPILATKKSGPILAGKTSGAVKAVIDTIPKNPPIRRIGNLTA